MNLTVIKRDGSVVPFNRQKIIDAVSKAGYIDSVVLEKIATDIENIKKKSIPVEQIQDLVEKKLMATSHKDVAREYIRYRYKRELIREHNKMQKNILEIVNAKNDYVNHENANKNPQILSTQRDYMAGEVSKDISLKLLLSDDVAQAHKEGIIHVHDLDYMVQTMHNCCLVNIQDMLQNGTVISRTMIETPHSFHTACNITTQIMAQVASNQYGGQSVTLSHLAPFVDVSRKKIKQQVQEEMEISGEHWSESAVNKITEKRVREEVKKGVQTIAYQIFTLLTTNGQTPFVTVFMYLNEVPEGQLRDDLAMIIEEMLIQRIQGVKNEKGAWVTPAFPKLIYVLSENNIHEDSKYWYLTQLAAKCTAKRMVPDYVSEKKCWEYKYPYDKLLPIAQRRELWGDEYIWGKNPFKHLSDDEIAVLETYVHAYRTLNSVPPEVQAILDKHHIEEWQVAPRAYCPMGCLDYNEKIELSNCGKIKIGQVVESINAVISNQDRIQRFIDNDNMTELVLD